MTLRTTSCQRAPRGALLSLLSVWALALLLIPGCGGGPQKESGPSDMGEATGMSADEEAERAEARDATAMQDLEGERRNVLVASYLANASQYLELGEMEKARSEILRAQGLAPNDPEVMALYSHLQTLMGDQVGESATLSQTMEQRSLVQIEQQKIEARRRFEEGSALAAEGNYRDAIRELEAVVRIIQHNPYENVSFGDLGTQAAAALEQVRAQQRTAADQESRMRAETIFNELKNEELLEQLRREKRIERLFAEAWKRFSRAEYTQAELLANAILDIDPGHKEALDLLETARDARHRKVKDNLIEAKREQYRRWLESVQASQVPYSDVLVWPSESYWENIVRLRESSGQRSVDSDEARRVVDLKNQLRNRRTDIEFADGALPEIIAFLMSTSGINIIIDPTILGDLEIVTIPGDISLKNITIESALNILLSYATDVDLAFRDGVVLITSKDKAFGKPVARLHDIRDITIGLTRFESPEINLNLQGGGGLDEGPPLWGKIEESEPDLTADDIIELIQANIGPDSWNANPGTIDVSGGRLLVVHTPEIQDQVAQFLTDLKKFMGIVVTIETRFLTVQEGFLQDIGVDFRGLGNTGGDLALLDDVTNGFEDNASRGLDNNGAGLPTNAAGKPSAGAFYDDGSDGDIRGRTENIVDNTIGSLLSGTGGLSLQWTYLDDTQVNLVVTMVEKSNRATLLTAPRLTAYNTQKASIHLINQITYLQDFEVEVAQTAFIADPVIGLIQEGIVFDVRPTVSNNRQYVTLELQPTVATLKEPIATFSTFLAGLTTPVTLQKPELSVSRAATTVKIPDGGSVVIGGLKKVIKSDSKSETPFFADLPIVGFLFSRKAKAEETEDLIIICTVRLTDLQEEEARMRR